VRVEFADESVDRAALQRDLEARLRVDLAVRVAVEPVPPGSLADLTNFGREGKVRRLLDRRPEYARKY
jgi:hypothetical protein